MGEKSQHFSKPTTLVFETKGESEVKMKNERTKMESYEKQQHLRGDGKGKSKSRRRREGR